MKGKLILVSLAAGTGAAIARARTKRPTYSFGGKSVVITGGSRGLGLLMARQLAGEGARLSILARNQEELDRAAAELTEVGADVLALRCDVGSRDQVTSAVERIIDHFGGIDVLINNAGIIQVGPLEHMSLQDFEDAMAVHLWGPLYLMQAALPHMRQHGEGRIVNISSIGGKIAVPHLAPYAASKFALVGLSDAVRAELAKDRITVTTVAPGLMRTGSPPNALFKGRRDREYFWFSLLDTLPFTAIQGDEAARQIIEACRRGATDLTITVQARLAILAETLAPGLVARAMQLFTLVLPRPTDDKGDEARTGWESRSSLSEIALLQPMYRVAERNNET
jgi:NAD(P)-dependent dehydrogenase (short-subunit alcohol dehydrogenase family)